MTNDQKEMELLAPNGKPSNLTAEQYRLVRTPEFKKWFGDWESSPETASKVVDENGEPLVVYHGTTSSFNVFSKENIGKNDYGYFGKGFYFGDLNAAEAYSQTSVWNQIHNTVNPNGRVLKCFLNIKTPLVQDSKNLLQSEETSYDFTQDVVKKHDGVISIPFHRFSPNTEYIVFESNQIKLADGSNTTFDSNNPDIRFAEGGEVNKKSMKKTSCTDFIKGSEAILANGYYSDLELFYLITYNSGGKEGLDVKQTINMNLTRSLSELMDVPEYFIMGTILTHYQEARRFDTIDVLKELEGKKIIIADRDLVVCSNIDPEIFSSIKEWANGGEEKKIRHEKTKLS